MNACGVCGRSYRTGTGAMVYMLDAKAALVRVRACGTCERSAVALVAGVPASRCSCGAIASVCDGCAGKAAEDASRLPPTVLGKAARKLRNLARGYRAGGAIALRSGTLEVSDERTCGRADGLEQAAELLEAQDY